MKTTENNWALGELVILPREEKTLKENRSKSYSRFIGSRYLCIREEANGQRGILMKVLGRTIPDKIMIVNGEPFCKDDHVELFFGDRYLSYPFPTAHEVMEVLSILRTNPDLQQQLEKTFVHINSDSTFWIRDTTRNMFFRRTPQYLSACDGQVHSSHDNSEHYRVTFVYFYKGNLSW